MVKTNQSGGRDTHKVLTPELRKRFGELEEQMGEFAGRLTDLCNNLEAIRDAVFNAQEIAECLIDDDLIRACEVMKQQQLPGSAEDIADHDWETDTY